jgi:hypothetical protein
MATCVTNTPEFAAVENATNTSTAWKEYARSKISGEAMRNPQQVLEEGWYRGEFLNKKPGPEWRDKMDGFEQKANSWPEYSLFKNPLQFDIEGNNNAASFSAIRQLAEKLKEKTGINYEFISQERAIELTRNLDEKQQYTTGKPAFFLGGVAYLVTDFVSATNVLHEYAHPIIKSIAASNNKLFNSLFEQVQEEYPDVIEFVKAQYDYLDVDSNEFKEEVIVTALDLFHEVKTGNPKATGPFVKILNDILFAIRQMLRKVVGKNVKVENISEFTTLQEMAEMLADDTTFDLDFEIVTDLDFVAYGNKYNEYIKSLKDAAENEQIFGSVSNTYDILIKQLEALEKDPNYALASEILVDKYGELEIKNIVRNLARVRADAKDLKEQARLDQARASEFVKAMQTMEQMIKHTRIKLSELKKEHKIKEDNNEDNRDSLQNVYYLDNLMSGWNTLIEEYIAMLDSNDVGVENNFYNYLTTIQKDIANTKRIINDIYTYGITDVIAEEIAPLSAAIDQRYERLLKYLTEKGAPPSKIQQVEKEYASLKLDPNKIKEMLKGDFGDAHYLNSFLEGYMNNQDPIVFGFASYVKNGLSDLNSNALEKTNKFYQEIEPLLQAAGFDPKKLGDLGERLTQLDTIASRDKDGNIVYKQVYKFINPWVGHQEAVSKINNGISAARDEARESGDYTEVRRLLEEREVFMSKYFHMPYTQKYYDRQNLLTKDEIGRKAKESLDEVDFEIREVEASILSPIQDITGLDELDSFKRKRKALFSIVDETGKMKTGQDLEIAKRLQEYMASSKGMFDEYKYPGVFEQAYQEAENELINKGFEKGTEAFQKAFDQWLKRNTRVEINDDFYVMRADLYDRIETLETEYRELVSQLGKDSGVVRTGDEMLDLYKELNDILYRYRDDAGQPQGAYMSDETLAKVKGLQEQIELLKKESPGFNGLTAQENAWLNIYYTKKESGEPITADEQVVKRDLDKKRILLKNKNLKGEKKKIADRALEVKNEILDLFDELDSLQKNIPTDDYLDILNNLTTTFPDDVLETLKNLDLHKEIGEDQANAMLKDTALINTLINSSEAFKVWFEANHILTEKYDKEAQEKIAVYLRTKAWSKVVPANTKYINKHTLTDSDGKSITIDRVPNKKYSNYKLKDKPGDGYVTPKIGILDAVKMGDISKANWDGDNWLPRLDAIDPVTGEPLTDFISKEFALLKSTKPAEYQLLMKLIEFHLENQQGHDRSDRLGLEIPRYLRTRLETLQRRKNRPINPDTGEPVKDNPFSILMDKIKRFFVRSSDDMEEGMNPSEESKIMVYTDSLDSDTSKIPVRGLYDLDLEVTSLDVLTGLTRYMYSLDRKAKLVEMNPVARALQSILSDPKNTLKETNKYNKRIFKNQNILSKLTKKDRYIRKWAIDNFIEREFEGKVQTGFGSESAFLQSLSSSLMKTSAFGYFALNISSAIKNSMGARMQAMIEGAAGIHYNNRDYARGTLWANKAMAEISFEIYKYGPKSLNIQLTELFDPSQGRFEEKITSSSGEKAMRTGLTDLVNNPMNLFTNTRKWTELNATYSIFASMMYSQKIEQTINGQTKLIPYIEAFDIVDGSIQLKEGIDKEWGAGGKKYKMMKNRIHAVSNDLNGAFSKFDYAEADRYFLFKQLFFLRRWFTRMFLNRFQVSLADPQGGMMPKNWRPRYDIGRNDVNMGFYMEAFKFMLEALQTGGKAFAYMTPEQKAAFKRIFMDVALMVMFSLLISLVFGFDADDPDKYEKLREKSGPLPMFGVADSENPFNFSGWLANNTMVTMMGIRQEQMQWVPIPGYGLESYMEWLELQPLALRNTVMTFVKSAGKIVGALSGDEKAQYVRAVGPYAWQQEGAPKFINYIGKIFGLTGSQVDPVKAAKDFVAIQNLKGN